MHRRSMLAAIGLLALPAAAAEQRAGDLTLSQPWTRAAGQGGTGVGFLAIANAGAAPDRLIGAASPVARMTEIHASTRDGDVMRMQQVPAVEIPAGQTVTLQPGGFHLMLIGLKQPLVQGAMVPLTLRFERAGEVQVQLAVQGAGARGPMGPMH